MLTKKVTYQTYEELSHVPETVYKYRKWEAPFENTVLTKREVFFSSPKGFEDPFDCKNPIRYDLLTKQDIFDKYYSDLQENTSLNRRERRLRAKELARNSPLSNKAHIKNYNEETFNEYCEKAGVLSLTANALNVTMWEKYSNSHKGFCVGFDAKKLFTIFGPGGPFGAGGPVIYVPQLPTIYPRPKHSFDDQQIMQIFYKEDKWKFEEEYRTHTFNKNPMTIQDRIVQLPPEVFKEVILGAKITEETKRDILQSIPDDLKHIPVKQAYVVNDTIVLKNIDSI